MADVDFPAWAWAWIVAGIVAIPLLLGVFQRETRGRAPDAADATPRPLRFHGRAMLWWALGVMTFALAEVFESDPLTWASLAAFAVGYVSLARRDAFGPERRRAAALAAAATAVILVYWVIRAYEAGVTSWLWLLVAGAAGFSVLALHLARRA